MKLPHSDQLRIIARYPQEGFSVHMSARVKKLFKQRPIHSLWRWITPKGSAVFFKSFTIDLKDFRIVFR